ncbi:hypothetical protein PS896_04688 [Pseudomonas fluorescens]|uniref:Lipoprotein n=1 Tax=Pseudomonas fluorescens TaxID=294 RepID=A0A5E7NMZ7_PSEFL|nr:hypothetical protein AK821_15415 [Pseudomonas sp. RIT-PI-r]VVP37700.1 hypothetical protein PS896_04688 [Pseudomonas fluorescens]
MLRKVCSTLATWGAITLSVAVLNGCTTARYDGQRAPDPAKAVIIGSIIEGYLTQPHGLTVNIKQQGEPDTAITLTTLYNEDDQPSPNLLGHLFMYEVPPGRYEFIDWNYQFYMGHAVARPSSTVFTVKAGQTLYIGNLYANALTYCLSNVNDAEETVERLKGKYPILQSRTIINLTSESAFKPWPTSDAKDNGKGLCVF